MTSNRATSIPVSKRSMFLPLCMFFVAVSFYLYEMLLRVAPNPMFGHLMSDFNIEAVELGFLASAFLLPYALLQIPVGALTDKLGARRLLTFAILLCASGTLIFAETTNFEMVCVARFMIGMGAAFAFISCNKIIHTWFSPKWFPILVGLTLTFGSLGGMIGLSTVSYALKVIEWRELFWGLGIVGLVLAALSWVMIRDGARNKQGAIVGADGKPVEFWKSLKVVMSKPQHWLFAFYGMLTTAPTDAFAGMWGTAYLHQGHGIEKSLAATAVACTFVGMAIGSPLMGYVSNRMRSRKRPIAIAVTLASASLFALLYLPIITFQMAAFLFFCFGFFGNYVMCFVIIQDEIAKENVATSVGFVNGVCMLGSTILTYLVGHLLSMMGTEATVLDGVPFYDIEHYQNVLLLMPLSYLAVLLVLPWMKETFPCDKA